MRETNYAIEIATAKLGNARIERIHVKSEDQEEIRFSWWPNDKMALRPLDLSEEELLPLMRLAIKEGIFTPRFLDGLREALEDNKG